MPEEKVGQMVPELLITYGGHVAVSYTHLYPGFPFVLVLFGEFFAHEEYQITYTYLLSRFNSQLAVAGVRCV